MKHFFNRDEVTINDIIRECRKLGAEEITQERLGDYPDAPIMFSMVYKNVADKLVVTKSIIAGNDELLEDLSNQFYKVVHLIPEYEEGQRAAGTLKDLFRTPI